MLYGHVWCWTAQRARLGITDRLSVRNVECCCLSGNETFRKLRPHTAVILNQQGDGAGRRLETAARTTRSVVRTEAALRLKTYSRLITLRKDNAIAWQYIKQLQIQMDVWLLLASWTLKKCMKTPGNDKIKLANHYFMNETIMYCFLFQRHHSYSIKKQYRHLRFWKCWQLFFKACPLKDGFKGNFLPCRSFMQYDVLTGVTQSLIPMKEKRR